MPNLSFARQHLKTLLIWPLIALLLGIALWGFTLSKIYQESGAVKEAAYDRAKLLTSAYAEQISRTLEHIDQTLLSIRHQWRKSGQQVDLGAMYADGAFPKSKFDVTIVDANGDVVTSTIPTPDPLSFGSLDWFQAHKEGRTSGLLIDETDISLRTGQPIIRLTRSLTNADGKFAGVVWATVDPSFLTTFYEGRALGTGEFISLRLLNGPMLASKVGGEILQLQPVYKEDPAFLSPQGIGDEPGQKFRDDQSRIVAWQKLSPYPLVAVSALTENEVFASFRLAAGDARNAAIAGTVLLFILGLVGFYYAARLAWRNHLDTETREIFRLAVDGAREGFYMVRPVHDDDGLVTDFVIADCNERGAALMGITKESLIGKKYSDIYSGEHLRHKLEFFEHGLKEGFYEDEVRTTTESLFKADWVQRRLVRSGSGLAMTIRDISDTKAHEQALTAIANTDALTGLPNRHWLKHYLPTAIEHARHYNIGLAVLFIDLDNFKNINDTLGHAAGDELLKAAAQRLTSVVRTTDRVVRLGGDEFTIVLEQINDIEGVSYVADMIIHALGKPFTLAKASGNHVQASIGISLFPQDGADSETLLKHADIAMYAAKAAGKGRCHFYQSQLSDHILLRVSKEEALRQAIDADEFVLYYQPRVDAITGKLCSMEALIRWRHPQRGIVLPVEFISVAEDTGLIIKMGEQVIAKACSQIAIWKAQGVPLVPISINVSALQFNEGKVKQTLMDCMQRYDIPASLIGVELTESCMVSNNVHVPEELADIRKLGIKLLIDDFGTGYSSLSQLQELDVDVLKVDQAFTHQLSRCEQGKTFFKAIASMAQALDISIVAEGVETIEQLRILQELSCGEVQGHFVSRPVPAEEVPSLIRKEYLFQHIRLAGAIG